MAITITAKMVGQLRQQTGAGFMECKKALTEAEGDFDKAVDIIAKSVDRKASKSAARVTAEGRLSSAISESGAAMVETNSQTDFVSRQENFIEFCDKVAQVALDNKTTTIEALLNAPFDGSTVEEARKALIAKLGENIQVRRVALVEKSADQIIGTYVHNARMGVLVLLDGGSLELAKDMAMQAVANKAHYVKSDDVPENVVAKEKEILMERASQSGKPADMLEKITAGQLKKYFDEICLMSQTFFRDSDKSVAAVLKAENASVLKMTRFEVGEGIEVIKKSFEEEVMAQAKGAQS